MPVTKLNAHIGERIKQIRLSTAKGQTEVANALGISVAALSKIENGLTDLNISRLAQIAKYLEVPIAKLVSGEEVGTSQNIVDQIETLKSQLAEKEAEISKLRKKVIDLYEKLGL
jgi:transcriptional regulator with XRE-family HTH domain